MIPLPQKFIDHTKGADTQLIPLVVIGNYNTDVQDNISTINNYQMHFSTQSISVGGIYFKPLVDNIPSLKESIDVESRKFKISSVNIKLMNQEFEGSRISDVLTDASLLNKEIRIYWSYPGATGFDYTDQDGIDQDDSHAFLVYLGRIRRLVHNEKTFTIIAEDLTEQKAHKDLPTTFLDETANVPDKFKSKPIPMVYGEVYRSPTLTEFGESEDGEPGQVLHIDSESITGFIDPETDTNGNLLTPDGIRIMDNIQHSPLHVFKDEHYMTVLEKISVHMELDDDPSDFNIDVLGTKQFTKSSNTVILRSTDLYNSGYLQVYIGYTPANVIFANPFEAVGETATLDDFTNYVSPVHKILDVNDNTFVDLYGTSYSTAFGADSLMAVIVDYKKRVDALHFHAQTFINGVKMPFDIGTYTPEVYQAKSFYIDLNTTATTYDNVTQVEFNGSNFDLSELFNNYDDISNKQLSFRVTNDVSDHNYYVTTSFNGNQYLLNFGHRFQEPDDGTEPESNVEVTGKVFDINHCAIADVKGIVGSQFFADVKGRVNTLDDHPFVLTSSDVLEMYQEQDGYFSAFSDFAEWSQFNLYKLQLEGWTANVTSVVVMYNWLIENTPAQGELISTGGADYIDELIFNPIDIIYDLVRKEIGHDEIDLVEYEIARNEHANWKMAFTVDRKINSKKLIQDIAKSTKCFPKFKNNGKFGFTTLKDAHPYSDYETATLIDVDDVINYSFELTKSEDIVTRVDVDYFYDYPTNELHRKLSNQSTLITSIEPLYSKYGIENLEDGYTTFETKYIRDKDTAELLSKFQWYNNRNPHLVIKLKLPLHYLGLEVGDIVKFKDLIDGLTAYGIDYTAMNYATNMHGIFPIFMVENVSKTTDNVSVELYQLHWLGGGFESGDWNKWVALTGVTEVENDFATGSSQDEPDEIIESVDYVLSDSITIPAGHKLKFRYLRGDSPAPHSLQTLFGAMFWNPNLRSVFPDSDGIISIGDDGLSAIVEEWFSTPENPYTILKFKHTHPNGTFFQYRFLDVNAHDSDHLMFMDWDNPPGFTLLDEAVYELSNYSTQSITFEHPYASINVGMIEIVPDPDATYIDPNPDIPVGLAGDANIDGIINVLDIVSAVNLTLHNQTPGGSTFEDYLDWSNQDDESIALMQFSNIDVNDDEVVNVLDVVTIVNIVLEQ